MEEYYEMPGDRLRPVPVLRRRHGLKWLVIAGLAAAFMCALAVGAFVFSSVASAASTAQGGASSATSQALNFSQASSNNGFQARGPFASGPGRGGSQGQCESLTVTSVNGSTILAKNASGSTVTIHTTASTTYTQAGKTLTASAAASALKASVRISVMGTHNSDGSITATSIVIG